MIDKFKGLYRFLSNFFPCQIFYEGIQYPTVENAYQAAKTKNIVTRTFISHLTPGKAKRYSRTVPLREDWDSIKVEIMKQLLKKKFVHPAFREMLLATGNEKIVEGNYWHDNFWGNCLCKKCKTINDENHLGKLLMLMRSGLKGEIEK